MNIDKVNAKIQKRTKDRRDYYIPSEPSVICPNLLLYVNGDIVITENQTDNTPAKKIRKCVCTQVAPICSYHLNESHNVMVNGVLETQYFCERYLPWYEDESRPPVDTHDKVLKIQNGNLNWY